MLHALDVTAGALFLLVDQGPNGLPGYFTVLTADPASRLFGHPALFLDGGRLETRGPGARLLGHFVGRGLGGSVEGMAQLLAYGLVYHGWYTFTSWYYAAQPLLAALIVGATGDWLWNASRPASAHGRRLRLLGRACVLAACCGVALGTVSSARKLRQMQVRFWSWPLYRAAAWARENLPAEARIGAWNAGTIGYFSERQVVNLDGLVNTRRYLESEQYDLCAYWDKTGITHVVDSFDPASAKPEAVTLPVTLFYARCMDHLELVWSEWELVLV